jgi:hypothetical protein
LKFRALLKNKKLRAPAVNAIRDLLAFACRKQRSSDQCRSDLYSSLFSLSFLLGGFSGRFGGYGYGYGHGGIGIVGIILIILVVLLLMGRL